MDLTPAQQKGLFAVIVVILAGLGYWLILPKVDPSHGSARAATSPSATASTPASAAASPTAAATVSPAASGSVNIYSWLPFTQQDLADAAAVAVRFTVDYNTYTYTESATAYTGKMSGLITSELAATLQGSYSTPGVAQLRASQKQVSTGTASVTSLRAFGPGSLTFVVTAGQRLVSSKGTSNGSTQYAITVTGSGASWQVDDIELASAGNT